MAKIYEFSSKLTDGSTQKEKCEIQPEITTEYGMTRIDFQEKVGEYDFRVVHSIFIRTDLIVTISVKEKDSPIE